MTDSSSIRFQFSRVARLGASAAAMAFALAATPAFADSSAAPDVGDLLGSAGLQVNVVREAQGSNFRIDGDDAVREPYTGSGPVIAVAPEPEILIAGPTNPTNTPTTARDPVNITGIGQMIIDQQNGFIGLCTGTLINPRTVLFAAHCVNSRAQGAYGAGSGGVPIAFGFETFTRSSGPGQSDELLNWYNGGSTGPGRNRTNVAAAFYNANYVAYNIRSLDPESATFLYADVALATLDTPAANVPTWAVLFSALPARPITAATGAGYHVTIAGYGNNGTGENGVSPAPAIDFRRRLAENFIGGLASLDQFENFLFGGAAADNPQNLYWIDFDDPRRGTAAASPFDFNAWRDNAVASGREGITSQGDSGGPLILDQAYSTRLVLGVLSGGYTRFFNGQPANSYGTAAFYQPLYLYWDYIAANNPYHYVTNIAGSRNWTDAAGWVTTLDPNYYILTGTTLVNGIPGDVGAGPNASGNTGTFGQACFQQGGVSECYDASTRTVIGPELRPIGTVGDNSAQVDGASLGDASATGELELASSGRPSSGTLEPQAPGVSFALPAATLANGLPGATGFVPNNFDGNRLTQVAPRYFDVTLGAAGTITLNSTVVIDRFKILGAQTTLDVTSGGSLTSLMDISHLSGIMQVNGTVRSVGDYFFLSGLLTGSGTVHAPFLTSVMGNFAPGTQGTTGTLTIAGNLVMGSASTFAVDLGPNGFSDRIDVIANGTSTGQANVGGRLLFSLATGQTVRANDRFTILTATGGVTGTFIAPTSLSAILTPRVEYSANAVRIELIPGTYASVVAGSGSQVQTSFAALLDANRRLNTPALAAAFGTLDLASAATISAFFESAAPRSESLRTALGVVASGTTDRFFRQRIHSLAPGEATGELAVSGSPLTLAGTGAFSRAVAPLAAGLGFDEATRSGGKLPDDMSGYLVGGYLNGSSRPMPAAASAGRDTFDGFFLAGGIEKALGEQATLGLALSYADLDGTTGGAPQQASSRLFQGTLYVAATNDAGLRADLRISAGALSTETSRTVTLGTTSSNVTLDDTSLVFTSELGLGFDLAKGGNFAIVPRASLRYESIGFDNAQEVGGPIPLTIERYTYEALEGRVGLAFSAKPGSRVRPFLEANYVHEFLDQPTILTGSFVGGIAHAPFALAGTDDDWGEISGGIAFELSDRVEVSLEADTTVFRDDFRNQSYRGRITIDF